jgi:hypothetical protein
MHQSSFGHSPPQTGVFTPSLTIQIQYGRFNPPIHPSRSSIPEIEVDMFVASILRDARPCQKESVSCFARKGLQRTALGPKESPVSRSLMIGLYGRQHQAPQSTVGESLVYEAAEYPNSLPPLGMSKWIHLHQLHPISQTPCLRTVSPLTLSSL